MKTFAMLFTLLMAGSAHALVKIPGSFVPSQCGEQKYISDASSEAVVDADAEIREVCLGSIQGENTKAVQFHFADGSLKLFEVRSTSNFLVAMMNGNTKSNYYLVNAEGEEATMKVVQTHAGQVVSVSGRLGDLPFFVPQLGVVYSMY